MKTSAKLERVDFRLTQEVKDVFVRAANLTNKTLSAFLIDTAYERANQIISEQERLTLSNEERDKFFALLDNPSIPNERAKSAMRKFLNNT